MLEGLSNETCGVAHGKWLLSFVNPRFQVFRCVGLINKLPKFANLSGMEWNVAVWWSAQTGLCRPRTS